MDNGGRYLRQPQRKRHRQARISPLLIIAVIAGLIAFLALLLVFTRGSASVPDNTADASGKPAQTATSGQTGPDLRFPSAREDGARMVNSLFRSTVFNPDCGGTAGENIASLEFTNTSGLHLVRCEFTAVTTDGSEYHFLALDVPTGQTVDAFETSNAVLAANASWAGISCNAVFENAVPIPAELTVSAEGTLITVTNNGTQELNNYVVHCHCSLDGNYFGGVTYIYQIETLAAGETVIVSADECYIGDAVVVRIAPADAGKERSTIE